MKRTMCLAFLALASTLALSGSAKAAPVSLSLTVQSAQSVLSIVVTTPIGNGNTTTALSGTQDITLLEADPISTGVRFDGGDIAMTDASFTVNIIVASVTAGFIGAHLTGLESTNYVDLNYTGGSWNYTLDPGDTSGPQGPNVTSAGIDQGILTYQGGGLASALGSGTLDFTAEPVEFALPSLGNTSSLTQTLLGSTGVTTTYRVVLSAPLTISQLILTDPVQVTATLRGAIVATGTYIVVPEPSTVILLGAALLGLVPFYRRLNRA